MKKVFLYISIGIILLAIPATILLVNQNQELRKRADPLTTLSLSPSVVTTKAGDDTGFDLDVNIDTAGNNVVAIQIVLLFDPTKRLSSQRAVKAASTPARSGRRNGCNAISAIAPSRHSLVRTA